MSTTGKRLQGRLALITGGGAGIGAASALAFAGEGASVLLVDRDPAALERTVDAVKEAVPGARCIVFAGDIAEEATAQNAVHMAQAEFGGLDALVNNAAMRIHKPLNDASPADWQAITGVNIIGMANFCRAAMPLLRASGRGSVVNVSSCYAVVGRKGLGLYDATKAAILSITRTLAFEEAASGVRINAVCPGSTLTDFHLGRARAQGKDVEVLKTERNTTSLIGRWAEPQEIALPILWLTSGEASFITGASLMVDGGLSIM
ncbi:MAG TPA: SDR family oxidoreductase [Burkholderiales bacterium]